MKERWKFAVNIFIIVAVISLSPLLLQNEVKSKAAEERYSAEVEFDFKDEPGKVIPQVHITKTNFDNGHTEKIVHEFPDQAILAPKDAQSYSEYKENDDPSLPKTFYSGCGGYYGTHIIKTKTGPQAVTLQCHATQEKKADAKGYNKKIETYILYKYDINRNLLTIMNKANTNGKELSTSPIDLYIDFGGYGVVDDDTRFIRNFNKRPNTVYSLIDNKILARTAEPPEEEYYPLYTRLKYTEYTKVSSKPKQLINNQVGYESNEYGKFKATAMTLFPDGTRTKGTFFYDSDKGWEETIGKFTYAKYPNPKGKGFLVGYRTSKGYTALSRTDASSEMEITKNKKYVVIHEKTKKEKKIKFIDAQTAKVVREIPDMEGSKFREVGDSILLFHSNNKYFYLHLPTGIISRNMDTIEYIRPNQRMYVGSDDKLVSLQAPPQMFVDGKQVIHTGQGPFLTYGTRWYVEVNDFAKAADATITKNSDGLTITRGTYNMTISNKDNTVLSWAGQTFVQLESLNAKLGMAGGFMSISHPNGYDELALQIFSKDLKKKDVIAQPDTFILNDTSDSKAYYYVMKDGKPSTQSAEDITTYLCDGVSLIFKGDELVNIGTFPGSNLRTLRNINFDTHKLKDIVAVYGKPQTTKLNGSSVEWYRLEDKAFVFIGSYTAYYILQ